MIRKIQTGVDNPILRQKSEEVKEVTSEIKRLVFDMIETMKSTENSIGLAAPQIGVSLRIIVLRISEKDEKSMALINPKIKKTSFRKDVFPEGCLSLPNLSVPVKRPRKISIEAINIDGQIIKLKTKGFLARIIQHEIDHLNGILISDKNNG